MPTTIRCDDCDASLLGTSHGSPEPIARDGCKECGSTEFYRPDSS